MLMHQQTNGQQQHVFLSLDVLRVNEPFKKSSLWLTSLIAGPREVSRGKRGTAWQQSSSFPQCSASLGPHHSIPRLAQGFRDPVSVAAYCSFP